MGESRRAWLGEKGGHGLKMGICMRNDFCCVCATCVASFRTNFWLIQMWPFFFVLVVATFFLLLKGKYSIIDLEFEISLENLGKLYSIVFLFTFFFNGIFFGSNLIIAYFAENLWTFAWEIPRLWVFAVEGLDVW